MPWLLWLMDESGLVGGAEQAADLACDDGSTRQSGGPAPQAGRGRPIKMQIL